MKGSTLLGIICGLAAIFGAFLWEGGTMAALFLLPAMLIVFGGTIAAGLAGTSLNQMLRLPSLLSIAFFPRHYDMR
jgi:chemotaxis protein MotA